jgi:hypothetical protein
MQNVPKIVRERLQAAPPAVNHPDADVLTAFAERSLPDLERIVVLEHLARCGDCRDIVALVLPEAEPVGVAVRPSPSGWLTWPALRWGFVAAGVVAIASVGILQFQRSSPSSPPAMALKQSGPVELAANEPKKAVAEFVAPPQPQKKEKLQSPAAPAFADSFVSPNATGSENDNKKAVARLEEPQAPAIPQVNSGAGSFHGAAIGGPLPHGPRVANQWQLQNNAAQNQAPIPMPPSPFAKQQQAGGASVNGPVPGAPGKMSETVEVSGAAPVMTTQDATLDARHSQNLPPAEPSSGENYAYAVGKAKPPVPLASRAAGVANNQTGQDQARVQAAPGQIGGFVVDPTGAVVSNARITITPAATGGSATAVTNAQGAWLIAGLPTGSYKAQAEAPGFRTAVLDFTYDANHSSIYSFSLSPGSASEMVEVASAQAPVQPETATIGNTITNREVSQIPIVGRNLTQIADLSPAVLPRWAINSAGGLQRSFDRGNTWQSVDVNANPVPSAAVPSLQVSAKTTPAKAKDADKTLKRDAATLTFRAISAMESDVWAGGSAGALYHSADAGNHWTRVIPASAGATLTGDILSLEFPDPQHGKVSTSTAQVWTTSDAGQTWQKQ